MHMQSMLAKWVEKGTSEDLGDPKPKVVNKKDFCFQKVFLYENPKASLELIVQK